MIEFEFIGFDIRELNLHQQFSADATVWKQDEELYKMVQTDLGIAENSLQLIEPHDQSQVLNLIKLVKAKPNAVLVSFSIPKLVLDAYQQINGVTVTQTKLENFNWNHLGYDVCDINGFFSFIDMTEQLDQSKSLFDEKHLVDAIILAQAANILIPSHSPFVVIKLNQLQV